MAIKSHPFKDEMHIKTILELWEPPFNYVGFPIAKMIIQNPVSFRLSRDTLEFKEAICNEQILPQSVP